MHVVGMVLHPERDCSGAVGSILEWAARREIQVLGIDTEIRRLACTAEAVTAAELRQRADLLVSLGGDGTMLRAMRLADRQRSPVLGVNLGKLGFLAEVDVPDLTDALSAIDNHEFTTEPRLAVDAVIGGPADHRVQRHRVRPVSRAEDRRHRGGGRGTPLRQLRRRRDRGRDADRLHRVQLLRRRPHREPRSGGAAGHAGRTAFGLQPRPRRFRR